MHNAEISGMRRNLVNIARYLAFPFFYNHFFCGGRHSPINVQWLKEMRNQSPHNKNRPASSFFERKLLSIQLSKLQVIIQLLFTLRVVCFSFIAVSGLKCHHCLSSSSLYDCGKSSEKIECPEIADNCANISTEVEASVGSIKSYFYGCATKKMCDDAREQLKVCQKISGGGYKVKCNITCCNGDLCSPIVTSQSTMPLSGHFFLLPVIISALSYLKDY